MLLGVSKLPVAAFDTADTVMLFSWIAYLYRLEFMVLHLTGSNPIFQIVYSALRVHVIHLNSKPHESCCDISQGSVLAPLFTPLSSQP